VSDSDHLYILWTNADPVTAEKMVFMYAANALKFEWWKQVTIIIWGSTATLTAENASVQSHVKQMLGSGVEFSACKACADELGVTDALQELGIEVIYWGEPLTKLLRERSPLLTV
jgi:hypothetical protein